MKNADKPINPVLTQSPSLQNETSLGLTKREYFAGLAMQGIMANDKWAENLAPDEWYSYIRRVTSGAVEIADELLRQLEKQ